MIAKQTTALLFAIYSSIFGVEKISQTNQPAAAVVVSPAEILLIPPLNQLESPTTTNPYAGISFSHGDISWLPKLALRAGWETKHLPKLGQIILRESGGCPVRRGGDIVDKNCKIIGHDGSNHASDTGLLQINGVNYNPKRNKWAAVCREMNICEQAPLFDPITNLKAGKLLYDLAGWSPWDPCSWDKSRCGKGG
ncbi:MAG: hypothetical protein FJ267_03820 [Planctomycetes bacterium]|nr:hypothetical protein [Planctomycetota bacterium]